MKWSDRIKPYLDRIEHVGRYAVAVARGDVDDARHHLGELDVIEEDVQEGRR